MKTILIFSTLALAGCGASLAPLKQEVTCTRATIGEAVMGDFSRWVLPDFVPGHHLRAEQFADCMPANAR